jgi:hypothetical protein
VVTLLALVACLCGASRLGVAAEGSAAPARVPGFLSQGWSPAEREAFWFTSQGSRVLSYDIFKGLEQADSEDLFRSAANMRRFGNIPWPVTPRNPDGLPIGFVRDQDGGQAWMGFTCAACHTNVVSYQGRDILIDGAPTLADFSGFMRALVDAMVRSQEEPKLGRLAARIRGETKDQLLVRLKGETAALQRRLDFVPADPAYGYGRLDAFGQIFNEVTSHALAIPGNAHPADAPVSYPFLWDTPQSDRVQWPGLAQNTPPVGALTRNLGEVLGVFARLDVAAGPPPGVYRSSGRLPDLAMLENQLKRLWRPSWVEAGLPAIRPDLALQGQELYKTACESCHHLIDDPQDPARRIKVVMTPVAEIGTDPRMVTNALRAGQLTGRLQGRKERVVMGAPLQREAMSVAILGNVVAGTLVSDPLDTIKAIIIDTCGLTEVELEAAPPERASPGTRLETLLARARDHNRSVIERARTCRQALQAGAGMARDDLMRRLAAEANGAAQGGEAGLVAAYKARPLDGIWATAPYLHNGSVPTLADLLNAPDERPRSFRVGSRELDPVKIGFRSDPADEGGFLLDTTMPGNSNAGHLYGTMLSEKEKAALLEYLKTL